MENKEEEKTSEKENIILINLEEDNMASYDEAKEYIKSILDKISSRFTKQYTKKLEDKYTYTIEVEFFERRSKIPVPENVIYIEFTIPKNLKKQEIKFQIKNEAVSYPLFDSINLSSFETLLDRVARDKYQMSKALNLHTNFEHSRITNLNGEQIKLFTIEEDENIFSNNKSEYYSYEGLEFNFKKLEVADIDKLIKLIWKTLVVNKSSNEDHTNDTMSYENFKLLFEYGHLDMSEENMKKLWKYANKSNTDNISYEDFTYLAIHMILCMSAFSIAKYKHEHNNCFDNKITNCVNIMKLHFKEYDNENNEEISFENLKKCLQKENDLFTRKEIDIILKQINPNKKFQYWKFDKILSILYNKYFDYQKLLKEDKIYKYLITIFSKQDEFKTGKLHYKKMKKALLTENKIKLNKIEILVLLNQFGINKNPEIEYFPASLILRNIVNYLHSSDIELQKIDITQPSYQKYEHVPDEYDESCKNVKNKFLEFDKDFDHLLNRNEFDNFVAWLIPYAEKKDYDDVFNFMDYDKDGIVNYKDFKHGFQNLIERIRIKNVIKRIKTIV